MNTSGAGFLNIISRQNFHRRRCLQISCLHPLCRYSNGIQFIHLLCGSAGPTGAGKSNPQGCILDFLIHTYPPAVFEYKKRELKKAQCAPVLIFPIIICKSLNVLPYYYNYYSIFIHYPLLLFYCQISMCNFLCSFMPYPLPPMVAEQSSHLHCYAFRREISRQPFTGSMKNGAHSVMYLRSK